MKTPIEWLWSWHINAADFDVNPRPETVWRESSAASDSLRWLEKHFGGYYTLLFFSLSCLCLFPLCAHHWNNIFGPGLWSTTSEAKFNEATPLVLIPRSYEWNVLFFTVCTSKGGLLLMLVIRSCTSLPWVFSCSKELVFYKMTCSRFQRRPLLQPSGCVKCVNVEPAAEGTKPEQIAYLSEDVSVER